MKIERLEVCVHKGSPISESRAWATRRAPTICRHGRRHNFQFPVLAELCLSQSAFSSVARDFQVSRGSRSLTRPRCPPDLRGVQKIWQPQKRRWNPTDRHLERWTNLKEVAALIGSVACSCLVGVLEHKNAVRGTVLPLVAFLDKCGD